jgi:Tol biopolymer transport system component
MLTAGRRVGPYEVLGLLGAGGMGEVYRARDTRLGREVALKTLPAAFATSPARLARLEQEARLLASLNDSRIATLYGLERSESGAPVPERVPRAVPFTTFAGREYDPAFSPQGESLAFAWDGGAAGNFDIYVKQIGSESMLRLTSDPAEKCCPAWSPDGNTVAFVREGPDAGIFTVPALGGRKRRVARVQPWFGVSLTFSPDGRRLAFTSRASESGLWRLAKDGRPTLVTDRVRCWGHWAVGRHGLYFVDQAGYSKGQLSLLDMDTGRIAALEALGGEAACGEPGLALSPDERWILYVQADELPNDLMLLEGFE